MDWFGEDDPVSHSLLSKDYALQSNLRGFLSENLFLKRGFIKQPKVQGREPPFSPSNENFR